MPSDIKSWLYGFFCYRGHVWTSWIDAGDNDPMVYTYDLLLCDTTPRETWTNVYSSQVGHWWQIKPWVVPNSTLVNYWVLLGERGGTSYISMAQKSWKPGRHGTACRQLKWRRKLFQVSSVGLAFLMSFFLSQIIPGNLTCLRVSFRSPGCLHKLGEGKVW